ncbi:hypothetical protein Tco_1058481 [Tanacetum coccineum]|uniref:Uncharacterized protein n=1 Tax=Tanacetum coccineum TaxID=301880 RepID=A0ABQ5H963_9ASTR
MVVANPPRGRVLDDLTSLIYRLGSSPFHRVDMTNGPGPGTLLGPLRLAPLQEQSETTFLVCIISMGNISTQGCSRINKILHGVLQCVIWVIWKWRNRIVNASPDSVDSIKDEDIFPAIQRISKNWINARNKSHVAN